MNSRFELGRISGVPIYLDMWFLLVVIVFGHPYFTSGNTQLMSVGLVVVIGVLLSILLHELGHAWAGRIFGVRTSEIELTGFGGIARFANSLPRSVLGRTVIYLAGPAANLLLWLGLEQAAIWGGGIGKPFLVRALYTLSVINFFLLVFNLLPAFPLDGGRTLEAWLQPVLGGAWAIRIVAILGLLVTAGCVFMALPTNFFMLFVAFMLFQNNWAALDSVGGLKGGR